MTQRSGVSDLAPSKARRRRPCGPASPRASSCAQPAQATRRNEAVTPRLAGLWLPTLAIAPRMLTTQATPCWPICHARASSSAPSSHPPVFTVEQAQEHTHHLAGRPLQEPVPEGQEGPAVAGDLPRRAAGRPQPLARSFWVPRGSPSAGPSCCRRFWAWPGQRDAAGDRQRSRRRASPPCSTPSCWRTSWSTAIRSRTTPRPRCAAPICCASSGPRATSRCSLDLNLSAAAGMSRLRLPFAALLLPTGAMTVVVVAFELARAVSDQRRADLGCDHLPVQLPGHRPHHPAAGAGASAPCVWVGFALAVLLSVWLATPRIALASGTAFLVGQLLDIQVFQKLRAGSWWRAPLVSSTRWARWSTRRCSSRWPSPAPTCPGSPWPWAIWG